MRLFDPGSRGKSTNALPYGSPLDCGADEDEKARGTCLMGWDGLSEKRRGEREENKSKREKGDGELEIQTNASGAEEEIGQPEGEPLEVQAGAKTRKEGR